MEDQYITRKEMKRISIAFGNDNDLSPEIKDLIKDSENGSIPALLKMGDLFEDSCKIPQNKEKALFCFQNAARIMIEDNGCPTIVYDEIPSDIKRKITEKVLGFRYHEQVTKSKHTKKGGIYMLYVDCFDDGPIIPFYIGKTNSFSKRYNQHINGINRLTSLTRKKYNILVEEGEFVGNYLYNKIYAYLDAHGCTVNDVKMVILEEVSREKDRSEREDFYIQSMMAPFFGFNQFLFQTHLAEHQTLNLIKDAEAIEEITNTMKKEISMIPLLFRYGYCELNTILTLPLSDMLMDSSLYQINDVDKYMMALRGSRYEIIDHIEEVNEMILKAQKEVDEKIVTFTPNPAADKAKQCFEDMFTGLTDVEKLKELCVNTVFFPDSISSVKLWAEAKSKGFWEDPMYEFKKRYPEVNDECQNSHRPVPPADTVEKKVNLFYRRIMLQYYQKFLFVKE